MNTFFKAVRPDGTDFRTGKVHWLPADGAPIPEGGWLVEHPHPGEVGNRYAVGYLSASSVETDCAGFQWPARLLSVEPVGDVWTPDPGSFPRKRAAHAWRVVEELPAWQLLGPQGRQVLDIIEHTAHLTSSQIEGLADARYSARYEARNAALDAALRDRRAAWDVARYAARDAARVASRVASRVAARYTALGVAWDVARDAARCSTWDVVLGWLVKDLIPDEDFRALTGPWEQVVGPIEVAV